MPTVTLSWAEAACAVHAGSLRVVLNRHNRNEEPYGMIAGGDYFGADCHACGAEMAAAKYLDRYWTPVADKAKKVPYDVGVLTGVQVRHTQLPDGRLLLHPEDSDWDTFVLVTGKLPTFVLVGWIYGVDGKKLEWWADPNGNRPCYFVPQSALRPVEELLEAEGVELNL